MGAAVGITEEAAEEEAREVAKKATVTVPKPLKKPPLPNRGKVPPKAAPGHVAYPASCSYYKG